MNTGAIRLCALLWASLILAASPGRLAGQAFDPCDPCQPCVPCAPACEPATCTIRVPQVVTEYQTRSVTRYRPEVRQRLVTVYRDVPTTETVPEEYTVLVPQKRTRTVTDTINHPVWGDIQLRTTAMTPEVDVRRGTYSVTRMVPVQEERVMRSGCSPIPAPMPVPPPSRDEDPSAPPLPRDAVPNAAAPPSDSTSATDAPPVGGACNTCCDPCPCKVCVTTWKPVSQQVTVEYPLTHFKPDSRLDTISFYEFKPETKFRKETYTVQVPEKRTRTRQITVMRPVAEKQPEQYTVMVPYQERIQVPVLVRRYVEQTVIVR
jgi:hypothetical protein